MSKVSRSELGLLVRLWPFAKPDAKWLLYAILISPLVAFCGLVQPYIIKTVVDQHIMVGETAGIGFLASMYIVAAIFGYLLSASYTIAISWSGQRLLLRLRQFLYERVISLPQSFFDRQPAGKLLTRLTNDVESLGESLGSGVVTIFLDLLIIAGCLGMMFHLDAVLTIIMLCCSPILIAIVEFLRRRLKVLYLEIRDAIANVNSYLSEQIDGVEILQLCAAEGQAIEAFDERNRRYRDACSLSNIYDSLMFAIVDGIGSIFIALLLWYGCGFMAKTGLPIPEIEPRSAGLMIAFIDYLNRLLGPIRDLSSKVATIQRALAALVKIFGLVDAQEPYSKEGEPIDEVSGNMEIKDLRFRYNEEGPEILKGISFTLQKGQVVALVGASGSGKTTLGRILDRSYTGYEGSILLDGKELSSLAIDEVSKVIATVRQDIHIFSETVGFNINLGNKSISQEKLDDAVQMTYANQMVARLGIDYQLQERGGDISVGEAQLLTFARTMAHDPEIIILDEATASVDSITEALIQQAITHILSEKTVIVIAHRLSTIQKADKILVMDRGLIAEQGTHDELMSRRGRYFSLFAAGQFSIAENSA